jgi:hypothetical protein
MDEMHCAAHSGLVEKVSYIDRQVSHHGTSLVKLTEKVDANEVRHHGEITGLYKWLAATFLVAFINLIVQLAMRS